MAKRSKVKKTSSFRANDKQFMLAFDKPLVGPVTLTSAADPARALTLDRVPLKRTTHKSSTSFSRPLAVTIKDACSYLGVGRTTIYDLMGREKLKWQKIGARRLVLFSSIEALLGLGGPQLQEPKREHISL